jgi:hypothetical protein
MPVKKNSAQEKGKAKLSETVGKKPASKKKKKLQFVTPSTTDVVLKPTLGTRKSLRHWLGG